MVLVNLNVGVLGHVDSGKTSLVRALSSVLSTAALDKSPQSRERGITLDLGFSAFTTSLPSHLDMMASSGYEALNITLVDCPGHASLIRTIIGGAQIIDLIILVVDVNKGIQTQTAECIVIGEIASKNMIVVLNKMDLIPEADREERLGKVMKRVHKVLAATKFVDAPILLMSAAIGGHNGKGEVVSHGIEELISLIRSYAKIDVFPVDKFKFYFAIDHCFAIKGQGTILTGTVLEGSITVGASLEIPDLHIERKVKSMQMFRQPIKVHSHFLCLDFISSLPDA
jgi:selenocysteine-specific elongation factor